MPRGGARKNAGRPSKMAEPVELYITIELRHVRALDKMTRSQGSRAESLRQVLDDRFPLSITRQKISQKQVDVLRKRAERIRAQIHSAEARRKRAITINDALELEQRRYRESLKEPPAPKV